MWLFAIYLLLIGMAGGWLAWIVLGKSKALKRPDGKPNWGMLFALGVAGSLLGGFVVRLLTGQFWFGIVASVLGSIAVVAIYVAAKGKK